MEQLTALLQSELKPALGVTEVSAIALASARAASVSKGQIQQIDVWMNGGMYKNAFSCAIPGTEESGCETAALLGALYGDWTQGLECLQNITQDLAIQAKASNISVKTDVLPEKENIYILAEVKASESSGKALIELLHSNITKVWCNDTEIFSAPVQQHTENSEFPFDTLTIEDLFSYASSVPIEEISFLQDMIDMNCTLAQAGQKGVGLALGQTLHTFWGNGMLQNDTILQAQLLTTAAMDARLSGLPLPAMSIVGSGSHGILCSLPVVSFGRSNGKSNEDILRALALSGLVTIYSKHYTGRLSSLCGCVLGGGSGASAGIVYLMGGNAENVSTAMEAMAANLTGMICDGGSTGCALKAYSGVQAAFLSAMLAVSGTMLPHPFGVVGSSAEQTTKNLGQVSTDGMAPMDTTILSIMRAKK